MQGFLTLEYVSLQTVPRIADADFALLLGAPTRVSRRHRRLAGHGERQFEAGAAFGVYICMFAASSVASAL